MRRDDSLKTLSTPNAALKTAAPALGRSRCATRCWRHFPLTNGSTGSSNQVLPLSLETLAADASSPSAAVPGNAAPAFPTHKIEMLWSDVQEVIKAFVFQRLHEPFGMGAQIRYSA